MDMGGQVGSLWWSSDGGEKKRAGGREGRVPRRLGPNGLLLSLLWTHLYCLENSVSDLVLPLPPRTYCLPLSIIGAQ